MGKIFFPLLDVGFNELRQIALTLCHKIVNGRGPEKSPGIRLYRRSFGA
jgi:hypothetical protein